MNNILNVNLPTPVEYKLTASISESTIQELRLADALGYERLTDIRKLIKRNLPALEAMGLVRQHGTPIINGKGRSMMVTEYHLNRAQAAFLIAKSKTKRAESLAILMAEVFAMFTEGRLVAADNAAAMDLRAAVEREGARGGLIHAEEKEARREAFAAMSRGRSRSRARYRPGAITGAVFL